MLVFTFEFVNHGLAIGEGDFEQNYYDDSIRALWRMTSVINHDDVSVVMMSLHCSQWNTTPVFFSLCLFVCLSVCLLSVKMSLFFIHLSILSLSLSIHLSPLCKLCEFQHVLSLLKSLNKLYKMYMACAKSWRKKWYMYAQHFLSKYNFIQDSSFVARKVVFHRCYKRFKHDWYIHISVVN